MRFPSRISAAAAVAALAAGCQSSTPRPPAPSHTPSPSATAFTLTDLARHPCTVLNAADTAQLHVTGGSDGAGEVDGDPATCHWQTSDGSQVGFTAVPSSSGAVDNAAGQPTATQVRIGGYRAVSSASALGPEVGCELGVAIGPNQSILLIVDPPPPRGVDTCTVAAAFGTAIVRHLR